MTHRILREPTEIEMLEKRSRFIGRGFPCHSVAEFEALRQEMEHEYADASHITYAYKILGTDGLKVRFHDAGEPSGTAGRPILSHLEGRDLINVAIFVIRYFGGIKLGAGGLVRAYGGTAKLLLATAPIADYRETVSKLFKVPYSEQGHFEYLVKQLGAHITDRNFTDSLVMTVMIPKDALQELIDLASFAEPL